jgi:hypothetical protein
VLVGISVEVGAGLLFGVGRGVTDGAIVAVAGDEMSPPDWLKTRGTNWNAAYPMAITPIAMTSAVANDAGHLGRTDSPSMSDEGNAFFLGCQ